jgi:hypothetical protein
VLKARFLRRISSSGMGTVKTMLQEITICA